MSLWKLRVGVEAYYLAQVASGLDEYYTGSGEAAGQWIGAGAVLIGLDGAVDAVDLRAVLAGLAPDTGLTPNGTRLVAHPRRVPGFDLTFSVPKSVSVVYALGDPLVQRAVTEACETALSEALAWLEREACFVRRGTNNRKMANDPAGFGTRRMIGEGFVAARFSHRTSRAGDPHLHWHVLVANAARGIDGRWSALDATALYRAQRTVGVVFQNVMRLELSKRLEVEWGPMHNDSAEVAGIPARVLREFSQRTEQIAEWMDRRGVSGVTAKTEALLETRTSKHLLDDFATLETGWHQRADALGWGSAELDDLLGSGRRVDPDRGERWVIRVPSCERGGPASEACVVGFEEWVEWLLTTRVTDKSGTFTRFDLTQTVASELPGTSITMIESTVHRALAARATVPVGDHRVERHPVLAPGRTVADDRPVLYTSRSLLAIEGRLLGQLAAGTTSGTGILDQGTTRVAIKASTLGPDQAHAIRVLTSAGDQVAVMVGRAGTGKTHTLGTLRTLYEAAGWDVIGLAPSARAARELHDGASISSTTIARHLVERREVTATTLVVVDEAAMAGTRDIAAVIDQAAFVGAKVVLVGDHHQLPEVTAGGAFRAALDTLGGRVVELTVNRRQQYAWERAALDQLRNGDVRTAFNAYLEHDRIIIADTVDDLHEIVMADWNTTRTTGETLLLAGTRAEAQLLNRHARAILAASGELDLATQTTFAGRQYAVGDHIVFVRNDRHQRLTNGDPFVVDNGMRGTVTDLTTEQMTITTAIGKHVVVDRSYLDRGWVDHAYAVTIHKAQGVTCDHVLVVGPAGLYREGAYVALSRARHSARLYATTADTAGLDERHAHGIPLPTETQRDPQAELLARLQRSASKNLVSVDDPRATRIAELVEHISAHELHRRERHASHVERRCGLPDPTGLRTDLAAAVQLRTHIDIGQRVRAVDRDNVGHVIAIDDTAGTCTTHFESTDGRVTTKTIAWANLVAIDNPDPVEPTGAGINTLAQRQSIVEAAENEWTDALADGGVRPGDAALYRRALHTAIDRAALQLRAEPPAWLTTWISTRPTTPAGAAVWDDATTRIAEHRLLHDIDNEPGIGPRPHEPNSSGRWDDLMLRLLEDRIWLATHQTPAVTAIATCSPAELASRRLELEQLLDTAPADQQQLTNRIVNSQLDPDQMHDFLTAATGAQDQRRDWIIANWPHIVELEQVTKLIAEHQPPTQPDAVRDVLQQLHQLAPELDHREERTLAELDRHAIESDPVLRLEAECVRLQQMTCEALTPDEREALDHRVNALTTDLRRARREQTLERAFDQYIPTALDDARTARVSTLAADTLTSPPTWVIEHLHNLNASGLLHHGGASDLATQLIVAAAHCDLHGHLPAAWLRPAPPTVEASIPGIELG